MRAVRDLPQRLDAARVLRPVGGGGQFVGFPAPPTAPARATGCRNCSNSELMWNGKWRLRNFSTGNYIAFKDLTGNQKYDKWSEVITVWEEKQLRERDRVDHDRGGDPEEAARLSHSFETDKAIFNTLKERFAKLDVETGYDTQAAQLENEKVKQELITPVASSTGHASKKQFPISSKKIPVHCLDAARRIISNGAESLAKWKAKFEKGFDLDGVNISAIAHAPFDTEPAKGATETQVAAVHKANEENLARAIGAAFDALAQKQSSTFA